LTWLAFLPITRANSASPSKIVAGASGNTIVSPDPQTAFAVFWNALIGAGALRVPSSM
jgi:hypothetical protein